MDHVDRLQRPSSYFQVRAPSGEEDGGLPAPVSLTAPWEVFTPPFFSPGGLIWSQIQPPALTAGEDREPTGKQQVSFKTVPFCAPGRVSALATAGPH